jgi:hypothetical protein
MVFGTSVSEAIGPAERPLQRDATGLVAQADPPTGAGLSQVGNRQRDATSDAAWCRWARFVGRLSDPRSWGSPRPNRCSLWPQSQLDMGLGSAP